MSKTPDHSGFTFLAIWLLGLSLPTAHGQTDELETHIANIKSQFQQLDASAQACLADAHGNTTDACSSFLAELDTEIPSYLQRCEALLDWREQVVTGSLDEDATNEPSLAQRLIDVEYTCGNDALIKRTNAVADAFEKVHNPTLARLPPLVAESTNRQTNQQLQFDRNSAQQNSESQRLRLQGEIQQQLQRIELQNLREQNRQPRNYNDFDL